MDGRKTTIAILLLVAVFGAVYLFSSFSENPITTGSLINNPEDDAPALEITIGDGNNAGNNAGNVIEITSSGFTPSTLTISKGDTVTWINKDTEGHWPASAMHPTHTKYAGGSYDEPGSYQGSQACISEGNPKTGAFDPCKALQPEETWSFTFNELGSWGYHDHLDVGLFGKIIVE